MCYGKNGLKIVSILVLVAVISGLICCGGRADAHPLYGKSMDKADAYRQGKQIVQAEEFSFLQPSGMITGADETEGILRVYTSIGLPETEESVILPNTNVALDGGEVYFTNNECVYMWDNENASVVFKPDDQKYSTVYCTV